MIGEILAFAYDWIPQGWKACDGSLLPIKGNESLFAILKTAYGGDGTTNFGLPNIPSQKTDSGRSHNTPGSRQSYPVDTSIAYLDAGDAGITIFAGPYVPVGFKPCDGSGGRASIADMHLSYTNIHVNPGKRGTPAHPGTIYFHIRVSGS